jgi:hypothetical protein
MATYIRAGLPEVATALAALAGEPHPLALTGYSTRLVSFELTSDAPYSR